MAERKCSKELTFSSQKRPRALTVKEVEDLLARVKDGNRRSRSTKRKEEPGLTDEARRWVFRS